MAPINRARFPERFARSMREKTPGPPGGNVSLARALSKLGFCSRAQARELIESGRVSVKGRTLRNPEARVRPENAGIRVDGRQARPAPFQYVMMHKPKGVITTRSDERGRKTVYGLLGAGSAWLFPVGRLDKETSGLLLLTNDTQWGNRIGAPESQVQKVYHVKVNRRVDPEDLGRLSAGIPLPEGIHAAASPTRLLRHTEKGSWIEVALTEGRNRQVRRMCEALGFRVENLVRVRIGALELGRLLPGQTRRLTPEEVRRLAPPSRPRPGTPEASAE